MTHHQGEEDGPVETQVEHELRLALAATAAGLPSDASSRLLAADYRPRPGLRRPAFAAVGAVVVAGAVVAVSLLGLGTDTPRAFAGWSATPTASSGDQARRAREACVSRLPSSARIRHAQETASGAHKPWPIPSITAGSWRTVVVDTRGPYTVILFAAAHDAAELSCFSGRQPMSSSMGGSFATHTPPPVPAGHVSIVSSGSHTSPPDEGSQQFSQLVGRTGPGVTGVTLTLRDGKRVTASLANGWFIAWWPGTHGGTATEVTTASGTAVPSRGGS
jgi:hypothetical protein